MYSMPGYFENMPQIGKKIEIKNDENEAFIKKVENEIKENIKKVIEAGKSDEEINAKGEMTAMQRIEYVTDAGSFLPLNSLYNPEENANGSTGIIKGIGKISGKWVMIVASDNKKFAGAWVPGQAENLLRASNAAEKLRIPLVYLLNCSGVKFDEQEKVYPGRRGGGAAFYENAKLNQTGIPVIVGIYGTNPAGGGYHGISPTIILANKDANMSIGGKEILNGMSFQDKIDDKAAKEIINYQKKTIEEGLCPPGTAKIHFEETGFFREIYKDDKAVLDGIKKYVDYLPSYNKEFFKVANKKAPAFSEEELYSVIMYNQRRIYDIYDVLARLFDGSEFYEYKKDEGIEVITGLAKVNGLLTGVIANVQGFFNNYPEYKEKSVGIGGKLYREGLIKMNEFVNLCQRDCIPLIWLQDTTGLDVGDDAEKAELLGLGQGLIYSNERTDIPSLEITLRKASAAAHYVMGGPCGNNNVFSIGTAVSEYYVMDGETAALAMYSKKLYNADKDNKDYTSIIEKMNNMIELYKEKSRPLYCTKMGMVDEIVCLTDLRKYIIAFTEAYYQNPNRICPVHQMLTPRVIRNYN